MPLNENMPHHLKRPYIINPKSSETRIRFSKKEKRKKKDSIKHLLYFLLPEPPPPHTDARHHTSRRGAFKHAKVCEYSVAIPRFVSMICPFSQFRFQIIDEFGFFGDVNNLICYGFFYILVF